VEDIKTFHHRFALHRRSAISYRPRDGALTSKQNRNKIKWSKQNIVLRLFVLVLLLFYFKYEEI